MARFGIRARSTLLIILLPIASVSLSSTGAHALQLSGTIQYTGSRGPVSLTLPIRIGIHVDPYLEDEPVRTAVTTNGGAFSFELPAAGTYYLGYWLDMDNDGEVNVGEPGEFYDNRLTLPGAPVTVPQSGLSLDFGDTLVPGITGSVTYTGDEEGISGARKILVQAFSEASLIHRTQQAEITTNPGRYELFTLDTNPRYLLAFVDRNSNERFDSGEPFEIFDERGTTPGDPVVAGVPAPTVNFVFGDEPPRQRLTATVTYLGSLASVSSTTPINVFMFDTPYPNNALVDQAIVASNGAAFALGASAAGNYYLAYVLDVDNSGGPNVGEPGEIYNDRSQFPDADPIAVPGSGISLSFDDSILLQGIAGHVRYTGRLGRLSSEHHLIVEAFSDALLRFRVDDAEVTTAGRFDIITLDTDTYYLRAFLDVNRNDEWDTGERFEVYNNKGSGQGATPVVAGAGQTAIDITFGDDPPTVHLSGTITYAGQHGPVSNDRPIVMEFVDKDPAADRTTISTSPGPFDLDAPASGTYHLAYYLDLNNDGEPSLGEPFEIYNDRFTKTFDTITVPQAGVSLTLDDTGVLSGIGGTVTYTGQLGSVSSQRRIRVEAYRTPDLSGDPAEDERTATNGGRYDLITLDAETSDLLIWRNFR